MVFKEKLISGHFSGQEGGVWGERQANRQSMSTRGDHVHPQGSTHQLPAQGLIYGKDSINIWEVTSELPESSQCLHCFLGASCNPQNSSFLSPITLSGNGSYQSHQRQTSRMAKFNGQVISSSLASGTPPFGNFDSQLQMRPVLPDSPPSLLLAPPYSSSSAVGLSVTK